MSKSSPYIHVLIAAAGHGTRMNQKDIPKQYIYINGKTILRHTIEKFIGIKNLKSLSVIINTKHQKLYNDAVKNLEISSFIKGGNNRKESIYNGLKSIPNAVSGDIILIHDAARPMVRIYDIQKSIDAATNNKAATLAYKIPDTIYSENTANTIDRNGLWAIQTPQTFEYDLITNAHEQLKNNDNFTDDRGMVEELGHKVELIESSKENFKITTKEDLVMAEKLLSKERQTITAMGFDVHAFKEGNSVRLGGIDIPHNKSLKGHSDADVVLHAITDAILGTINEGDIGTHFPPSDPKWHGANSSLFLNEAVKKLNDKNSLLEFIDITILSEEPKIGPHREAMQKRISDITSLNKNNISIKATTTEKLGFTGRGEGIACQVIATITKDRN